MTQKHFIAIAATIHAQLADARSRVVGNNCEAETEVVTIITTTENLCNVFADENPRFNRARFLAACGIN